MKAGFAERMPSVGVKNNADLFYSASHINYQETVVYQFSVFC